MKRANLARLLLLILSVLSSFAAVARADFSLKDGDIWVMAGDSITAQHLHSNYFEAYCFAHYPQLKFSFRNSGVGGHTIPSTLARFDYDIAAWNPTVVSVELGMNDQGGTPTDKFVENMKTMVDRIRAIKARPIILTSSPINNGSTIAAMGPKNRLNEYATALKEFAAKENIPFADQFHAIADVWAMNKPKENVANALSPLRAISGDDTVAGIDHLRAFIAAQDAAKVRPVSMQGDGVHPGPPGQLMMAAALLKELGTDGFVSSVTIGDGKLAESKACKVDALKSDGGKIEFDRLDERSAFPIPDEARDVMSVDPTILALSQYTLKVTGLTDGNYAIKINNIPTATLTAKELGAGVNLTSFGADPKTKEVNPIVAQARAILGAVNAKEGIVGQWRGLSQRVLAPNAAPELKDQLTALTKTVEAADEKIRAAAKPQTLHFEISPAK